MHDGLSFSYKAPVIELFLVCCLSVSNVLQSKSTRVVLFLLIFLVGLLKNVAEAARAGGGHIF